MKYRFCHVAAEPSTDMKEINPLPIYSDSAAVVTGWLFGIFKQLDPNKPATISIMRGGQPVKLSFNRSTNTVEVE